MIFPSPFGEGQGEGLKVSMRPYPRACGFVRLSLPKPKSQIWILFCAKLRSLTQPSPKGRRRNL